METHVHTKSRAQLFLAALFTRIKIKTTQTSINWWMNNHEVAFLLPATKGITQWCTLRWRRTAKTWCWGNAVRHQDHRGRIPLIGGGVKVIKVGNTWVASRGWGPAWNSSEDDKSALELTSSGGYKAVWLYEKPLNCTLQKDISYLTYLFFF